VSLKAALSKRLADIGKAIQHFLRAQDTDCVSIAAVCGSIVVLYAATTIHLHTAATWPMSDARTFPVVFPNTQDRSFTAGMLLCPALHLHRCPLPLPSRHPPKEQNLPARPQHTNSAERLSAQLQSALCRQQTRLPAIFHQQPTKQNLSGLQDAANDSAACGRRPAVQHTQLVRLVGSSGDAMGATTDHRAKALHPQQVIEGVVCNSATSRIVLGCSLGHHSHVHAYLPNHAKRHLRGRMLSSG
jgi:hypothetical protein